MNTTQEIIADLAQGKMVIIMDDEERENEGDLVLAASFTKAWHINFMAKYGRGLICLTLTQQRCQQLHLPLMVYENKTVHSTNFTVSIEAANGVTTGISAADRALTVQVAVAADTTVDDLVQPGHIFPLMATTGGVLNRAGHTEAGCDLARLAGSSPAAVIVEILNDDGTMARRDDLEKFAKQHQLKIGTIADLIQYRVQNENTLDRISKCHYPTQYGDFTLYAYQDRNDNNVHLALVMGDVAGATPVLVRVHAQHLLDDLFLSTRAQSSVTISHAMEKIAAEKRGVLVIIRQHEDNKSLVEHIHHYQLQDNGVPSPQQANKMDWRTTGTGARILADLGVHRLKVMATPKKYFGLASYGIEVVEHTLSEE